MGWNAEQYTLLLESLLPRGKMWPRGDTTTTLYKVLQALAEELVLVDGRGFDLIREKDPSNTVELLSEFEIDFGLPESWFSPGNHEQRIIVLLNKFLHSGSLCPSHYLEELQDYGYFVTFEFFTPFWCGVGVSGDPCGDQYVLFVFRVWINYKYVGAYSDSFDSSFDRLGTSSDTIRGIVGAYKPAYTRPIYSYGSIEFGMDYSKDFNSMPSQELIWLQGAFDKSFDLVYDICAGGGFYKDGFDWGFDIPL